jgi:hypothetical protein
VLTTFIDEDPKKDHGRKHNYFFLVHFLVSSIIMLPIAISRVSALQLLLLLASLISSGMSLASSHQQCAVIGCGVLGKSLCQQLLASPDFEGWTGAFVKCKNLMSFPS